MNVIPAIPHILRESSRGIDAVSVYDEMLERRELVLLGEVEPSMAQLACQCVRHLERLDPAAPITVFVESPGGEVRAGLALFDVLRSVSCPVRTVCTSTAASMGAVIFMAGDERAMYPHAELMVHDPLIPQGAGGSALSVQETSRRLMSVRATLTKILAERSGLSLRRVQRLTGTDTYLSAEKALELGFATSIVTSKKED